MTYGERELDTAAKMQIYGHYPRLPKAVHLHRNSVEVAQWIDESGLENPNRPKELILKFLTWMFL